MNIDLWPLIVYSVIVIALVPSLLVISALVGQKRRDHATDDVYESGVLPVGSAQIKIAVPFYLTAILFIIFDLEAAFLLAWAISIREAGWLGYVEVCVFIFILLTGLLYLWRSGALEWRTKRQQHDLAHVKGEGGVTNMGSAKIEAKDDHHGHAHADYDHTDQGHGADAPHSGAAH